MPIEMLSLLGCSLLVAVTVITQGVLANRRFKPAELLGARDTLDLNTGMLGRSKRAMANLIEAVAMFVPAVLAVLMTGQESPVTAGACIVFLIARVVYLPAYLLDPPVVRSLVWFAGFVATMTLVGAVLVR